MYEQAFNFSQRPFNICPTPEEFFPGQSHQQAVDAARSCIERRNGPVVLIGSVGTGKSLTLQVIGEVYSDQFDIVSIECSRLEQRSELLQSILFGLGLPFREMREGELRLSLIDHLKNGKGSEEGMLLLVDEADRLSVELLDELRLITNIVRQGRSQVQLMLAGTQRLEESLNDPRLASFNQRVAVRTYLQNLSHGEISEYISDHIRRVGGEASEVFEDCAISEIARCTDGCPRLINQLCERALVDAAKQSSTTVQESIVRQAWAELQNLPVPGRNQNQSEFRGQGECHSDSESVVEFGSLDDDGQGTPVESEPIQSAGSLNESVNRATGQCEDGSVDDSTNSTGDSIGDGVQTQTHQEDASSFGPFISGADSQIHGEIEVEDPAEGNWGGRLPKNLAMTDFPSGFQPHPPLGMGGIDPFAPETEDNGFDQMAYRASSAVDPSTEANGFVYGQNYTTADSSILRPIVEYDSSNQLTEYDAQQGDAQQGDAQQGDAQQWDAQHNDPRVESLQQEQENLLHHVDAATRPTGHPEAIESGVDGIADADGGESDVQSAFDGLNQIDQARSEQPFLNPLGAEALSEAPSNSGGQVVDPFDEDFEEEVLLQDTYSPFVATQNQSSLSVTSENLAHLMPRDQEISVESKEKSPEGSTGDLVSVCSSDVVEEEVASLVLEQSIVEDDARPSASFVPVQAATTELSVDLDLSDASVLRESVEMTRHEPITPQSAVSPMARSSDVSEIDPEFEAHTGGSGGANEASQEEVWPPVTPSHSQFFPHVVGDTERPVQPTAQPVDAYSTPPSEGGVGRVAHGQGPFSQDYAATPSQFGSDDEDCFANKIRYEAEGIVKELQQTIDSGVSHETNFLQGRNIEQPADAKQPSSDLSPPERDQQVLRELMEQQHGGGGGESDQEMEVTDEATAQVDSVSVEYPITEHGNYQATDGVENVDSDGRDDDRDILRVSASQYTQPAQEVPQPRSPLADAIPSTGEAQRMDYGQLFDQLRNLPKQ